MITFYSGTPGSGKSLHTARDILDILRNGHNVICNFPVNLPEKFARKPRYGNFYYLDNSQINPAYLVNFALENHKEMKENQTTVILDEAGILFNSRSWDAKNRTAWCTFFSQHRKYGFNFIIIAQFDRQIDRQIRSCFEYEVKHRKVNNFGFFGAVLSVMHIKLFFAITYWYGLNEKCGVSPFTYHKRYSKIYNTFGTFNAAGVGGGCGGPARGRSN
ncbi:MAG: zonular occludens toxin domain-containing protein [Eubacteriales bacterium]|nr:zonular occludens toxin domain-containing protein [Eubacteriales bacterium]